MVKNADPIGSVVFAVATSGRYGTGKMSGNAGRAPHSTRHGNSTPPRHVPDPALDS